MKLNNTLMSSLCFCLLAGCTSSNKSPYGPDSRTYQQVNGGYIDVTVIEHEGRSYKVFQSTHSLFVIEQGSSNEAK